MDLFYELEYYNNIFPPLNLRVPQRHLRDAENPYDRGMEEFKRRYRFSQDVVLNFILPIIFNELNKPDNRGNPIAPELQILICLRFYATASFQIVCGDLLNVSQPSASNIVARVSRLLALQSKNFIKFPENMVRQRARFAELGAQQQLRGFSGVDGAIDCTHIKIVSTPGAQHHEVYRNRKSYFSINVQAVVGPHGEFLDIVARWAGSTHDSRIFQMSRLYHKYTQNLNSGFLLGDSGYPCLRFLLTPVQAPASQAEERYNKIHIKTRNVVERTFGRWKRRFPCLHRGLGNKLSTVSNIIVACAVLFNISLQANDMLPLDDDPIDNDVVDNIRVNEGTADGFAVRASVINRYV